MSEFLGTQRYTVERRLGEGGMGVVYQVHDRELRHSVALKTLNRVDATGLYHLKREFRSLADVVHPNLVTLHDLVASGDQAFFTMELVRGVSFVEWVRGEERRESRAVREPTGLRTLPSAVVTPADALTPGLATTERAELPRPMSRADFGRLREALTQLCDAVHAIHLAGKLHRDLKPTNVLVEASGRVVVLDFGLVGERDAETDGVSLEDELILGTPAYMSPEQAAGERATPASDWYAVGVMLFGALTGRLPFEGTVRQVLSHKQFSEAPAPSRWVHGVPPDLDALATALLARDASLRPGFGDIAARLRLGAVSVVVTRAAAPTPVSKPVGSPTPLLGRGAELEQLLAALRDTRAGRPRLVLVRGAAGLGKTALLDRFVDDVSKHTDTLVLSGRCYSRESVPYKALDAVVDALSRHLKKLAPEELDALLPRNVFDLLRLFPVLERVEGIRRSPRCGAWASDAEAQRPRAFSAVRELFARLADRRPVLVKVDDLEFGDRDSADLLSDLVTGPDAPALLFVGAFRKDLTDPGPLVTRLLAPKTGELAEVRQILELGPLDYETTVSLALDRIASCDDMSWGAAKVVAREAAGNPLRVQELGMHVAELLNGDEEPDVPLAARAPLPDILRARLAHVDAASSAVLEVLAVAGGPVETPVLTRVLGLDEPPRYQLESLVQQRLVRNAQLHGLPAVELVHDHLEAVVLEHLESGRVRKLHRLLASELAVSGHAEPEILAHHFEAAGERAGAREHALRAAEKSALALAFDRSAHFYEQALRLGPERDGMRWQALTQWADALMRAGRPREAIERLLEAATLAPPLEAVRLTRRAAELRLRLRQLESFVSTTGGEGPKLFDRIPRDHVEELLARCEVLTAPQGDPILSRSAPRGAFYVVVSGRVELRTTENGSGVELDEGSIFGEIPFLTGSPLSVDVFAASANVRLLEVSQASLDALGETHPRLAFELVLNVSRVICEKATGVRERALSIPGR
jgi:serine/threonine protein kinase/CRP-like cAMP-binding protein